MDLTNEQQCCVNCAYYISDSIYEASGCRNVEASIDVFYNEKLIIDSEWTCPYFTPLV